MAQKIDAQIERIVIAVFCREAYRLVRFHFQFFQKEGASSTGTGAELLLSTIPLFRHHHAHGVLSAIVNEPKQSTDANLVDILQDLDERAAVFDVAAFRLR